jgi:hypothetical protein
MDCRSDRLRSCGASLKARGSDRVHKGLDGDDEPGFGVEGGDGRLGELDGAAAAGQPQPAAGAVAVGLDDDGNDVMAESLALGVRHVPIAIRAAGETPGVLFAMSRPVTQCSSAPQPRASP